MGGHLPLAAILDVDFERENAVGLLVLNLHVDEAAQYGGLAIYADLRLAVGERLILIAALRQPAEASRTPSAGSAANPAAAIVKRRIVTRVMWLLAVVSPRITDSPCQEDG